MRFELHDPNSGGIFRLYQNNADLKRDFFKERGTSLLTIAWNQGADQVVTIDGQQYTFPANHLLALVVSQTFFFENPASIVAWQFNREFYCIINHDVEVACSGLLFYGSRGVQFVDAHDELDKLQVLLQVFSIELEEQDVIQHEMLRTLLKRLITRLTRLYKSQYIDKLSDTRELELIRKFNMLVETHYKQFHKVQDYAEMIHRSPKTLANLFLLYHDQTPLQVIHQRICMEAKRMLMYTDRTTKEIAREIGFEEVPHFSRFFKKMTGLAPTDFRETRIII